MKVLIYWRERQNTLEMANMLQAEGHQAIIVQRFSDLRETIFNEAPDVLLCHSHTTNTPQSGFRAINLPRGARQAAALHHHDVSSQHRPPMGFDRAIRQAE